MRVSRWLRRIPPRCPRASCFAERLVLTVRTELTDRMLFFGERHLRRVLGTYTAHYNMQRPHRGLQLRPPRPETPVPEPVYGRIRRRAVAIEGPVDTYGNAVLGRITERFPSLPKSLREATMSLLGPPSSVRDGDPHRVDRGRLIGLSGLKRQSRHDRVNCGVRESPAGWCYAARWA
jgi:hypothetical protein